MTTTTLPEPLTVGPDRRATFVPFVLGGWALLAAALAIAAFVSRGLTDSVTAQPIAAIPIFHLVAELFMAVLPAVGAVAWWRGVRWGPAMVLFGFGTWIYAVANAVAWAVVNDPVVLTPMLLSLVVAGLFGTPLLLRPARAAFGPRTRWRTAAMVVLLLFAIQVFALWTMYFVTGEMGKVLTLRSDTGVLLVRDLMGELPLLLGALAAAVGWRRKRRWAPGLALVVLGMFFYQGVNNLSPAVVSSTVLTIYCAATVAMVFAVLRTVARAYDRA
jgi:hypothetical protein